MEGAGLSAACESKNREWIIAKGICDFADGNKSANKDVRQKVAADSSVDLLCHVLSSEFALKDLGCLPEVATSSRGHQSLSTEELKKIYFDQYGSECEPYYLCRDHDRYLAERASFYSLWLYGPPGCGKTASIRRCLAQSDKDFTYVSLATCANYDDRELLA
jgi:hypothetical protein